MFKNFIFCLILFKKIKHILYRFYAFSIMSESYSSAELNHFSRRKVGSISGRPQPRTLRTQTKGGMAFADSVSPLRYVKSTITKDPDAQVVRARAHQRFISRGDDDYDPMGK